MYNIQHACTALYIIKAALTPMGSCTIGGS